MDVAGDVEEEEAGAGERVVRRPRDLDDADVVVPRLEFREGFHVFDWDSVVVGGGGIGGWFRGGRGGLVGFDRGKAVAAAELDWNCAAGGDGGGRRRKFWVVGGGEMGENLSCGETHGSASAADLELMINYFILLINY